MTVMDRLSLSFHKPHRGPTLLRLGYIILLTSLCQYTQANDEKVLEFPENTAAPYTVGNLALDPSQPADSYQVVLPRADSPVEDLPDSPLFGELFDFQTNGDVIARQPLDREKKSEYNIIVAADGVPYQATIRILDVNDNRPTFDLSVRNITVSENLKPGDELSLTISATDRDEGANSTQRYELIRGSNGMFKLGETQVTTTACIQLVALTFTDVIYGHICALPSAPQARGMFHRRSSLFPRVIQ